MGRALQRSLLWLCLVIQFFFGSQCLAHLGAAYSSLESDAKSLGCKKESDIGHQNFRILSLDCDWGKLREFISTNPAGSQKVFGVAWNGIAHPDFQILLGIYLKENQEAFEKKALQGRASIQKIRTDSLIFEKWGHSKNLQGRAFDPTLIPYGVSADEIQ